MYRNAAPHYQIQLALDQRQEICHCFVTDVVSCRREELSGQELFPIGDLGRVCRLHSNGIGLVVNPAEDHDPSGFAAEGSLHAGCTDLFRLVNVRLGTQVRGATLHDVQLYRTHLTAECIPYQLLQILADTGQILVSKVVHQTGLYPLRHGNALGNCHDHRLMFCHFLLHVVEKTLSGEMGFRHVDQMRAGSP